MKSYFLLVLLALFTMPQCASAPSTLSPVGTRDYRTLQVVKALDLVRDTAIDANAQIPPLLDEETTRKIVMYHSSALRTIQAVPNGWVVTVEAGLDDVIKDLPADKRKLFGPYIALTKTLITEVTK
jgi:hypothetical protein